MNTDQFIYSHEYISARIYSFLKFKKYMKSIAKIVCEELDIKDDILDINITSDSKTVWVTFKDYEFGFDSALLWDQNLRSSVKKYLDYDSDTP